jgi:CcmD family protein
MGNLNYLFAAFAVIWVGLLAYVFFLVQKQGQLRRDIDRLKEMLSKQRGNLP